MSSRLALDMENEKILFYAAGDKGCSLLDKYMNKRNIAQIPLTYELSYKQDFIFILYESVGVDEKFISIMNLAKDAGIFSIVIAVEPCDLQADLVIDCDNDPLGTIDVIYNLVYLPGIINIDVEDVRNFAEGRLVHYFSNKACINDIAENIDRKCQEVAEPLMNILNKTNSKISSAIFCVLGDRDLSLFEINDICISIESISAINASLIFGARMDLSAEAKFIELGILYVLGD